MRIEHGTEFDIKLATDLDNSNVDKIIPTGNESEGFQQRLRCKLQVNSQN